MNKMVSAAVLFLIIFITACSKNPYQNYIGYWELEDAKSVRVLKISKDGETYLIQDNVFSATKFGGGENKPTVLSESDNKLTINTGLGSMALGLSENGNVLFANGQTYKRIQDTADMEKNIESCHAVKAERKTELDKAGFLKSKPVYEKFAPKLEAIPYCI